MLNDIERLIPMDEKEIFIALQERRIPKEDGVIMLKELLAQPHKTCEVSLPLRQQAQKNQPPRSGKNETYNPLLSNDHIKDIAVVGMSGRFPGASNIEEFWLNIERGVDSVTEIPEDRWALDQCYDTDHNIPNKSYSKWGGFLEGVDQFDPLFFNISPKEAELMDPQQRLFLEEAWKAIEDAGYAPKTLSGANCGVFVGVATGDYQNELQKNNANLDAYRFMGNSLSILAGRISYFLNLKGANIAIDTACSSSLVAIHEACKSIINGESLMAFAGGVCVITNPDLHIMTSKAGMLSPEGRCKTFDQSANGFVPSEGVGVVILKSLQKAIDDNDHIYGVIKGSRINQDGSTNGITAPSVESQTNLELSVYEKYGIDPSTISYVECHGTGTKLGDPIEMDALKHSFEKYSNEKQFCAVGSVKTNIGHALTAAGVASVIKVLMAMKYKELPASIHFKDENEHISFKEGPFYVNSTTKPWVVKKGDRRKAAISSFGFSGTNAHIVVEEYIPENNKRQEKLPVNKTNIEIIPLSAKNEERLKVYAEKLLSYLKSPESDKANITTKLNTDIRDTIENEIAAILSNSLNMENGNLDRNEDFINLGIDQIILSKLHQELEDKYSFAIELKVVSLAGSISDMSNSLSRQYQKEFEMALGAKVEMKEVKKGPLIEPVISSISMKALAYTLQTGRDAMGERVAFLVEDRKDLIDKLEAFVYGNEKIQNCYHGKVKKSKDSIDMLTSDDDSKEMVGKWIAKGKVKKLAELWSKGFELDWNLLYGEVKPGRISAPTYPFAKERYWIPLNSEELKVKKGELSYLHPLLHTNTSDLEAQQFSSTFTGQEFFLADHRIKDEKVLPGVAYLEMARAAGELASRETVTHLENIVWAKPITVNGNAQEVKISLYPENNHIAYEVHTCDQGMDPIIHSQGQLITESVKKSETKNIDIKEILARCKTKIAPKECYDKFNKIGLNYGPAFQGIHELYVGATEALGRIELPETVTDKSDMFRLHPCIMDAALQTTIGLNASEDGQIALPFALKELCIINEMPTRVYAYAKHSEGVDPNGSVVKFDIDIADEAGRICFSLKEFTARVFSHAIKEETGMFYATPEWREENLDRKNCRVESEIKNGALFLSGVNNDAEEKLKKEFAALKIEHLDSKIDALTITKNFKTVFKYIKEKLETKSKEISPVLVLFQGEEDRQLCATFAGLFKTARIENPAIQGKIIEVRPNEAKLSEIIARELEPETFNYVEIRYTDELKREAKKLKEIELRSKDEVSALIKEGGVYWITGGLGGLGRIFAEHLNKTKNVKLILSGRSELDNAKQTQLETLKATGICAEYLQGDISIQEDVEKVVTTIKEKHNQLDGIIHSAGAIRDSFIIKKTEEDIEAVFKPKISGILNIDEVTKNEKLDFIVLFSSIAGVIGNVGQSDYSSSNAFLDVYAEYRNELVKQGYRSGKTISINWPLWEEGGMDIDEQSKRLMKEMLGICPLKTKTGVRAFDKALLSNHNQLVVLEGDINKIEKALFEQNKIVGDSQIPRASAKLDMKIDPSLIEKMTEYLKDLISSTLKIGKERIDVNIGLEKYGIDSIIVTELTNLLEKVFGSLSKTLFFEYQTVSELATYFVNEHRPTINQLFSSNEKREVEVNNIAENNKIDQKVELSSLKQRRFINYESKVTSAVIKNEEIAIVGISGRYPQARDLNKFWENLLEGRNCITEIPKERWDYNDYNSSKYNNEKVRSIWGGFIEDVDMFDPLFFNISPKEAIRIDPQERLFLETVWETLENSGYTRGALNNDRVGVFVGSMYNYYHLVPKDRDFGELLAISSSWSIANRVSYFFNFKGPSMAINTACSSSLNAIYMACESIKRGECNYAVAGGVNLSLRPSKWVALSEALMIGSEGKSKSLGDGDGYVPGEGVGAVLLKPLDEAIKANDQIYAVIKGGFINHNGKANGYAVPDPNAQADLIREALERANVKPETIGYIETACNGSSLGDPIEISGLLKVFKDVDSKNKRKIPIGSVKSNIGHCEAASGISQLTKVICQFVHKKLAPSINAEPINPNINLEKTPFYIQKNVEEWEMPSGQQESDLSGIGRRALISSFGAGGSNAHLVLEEFKNNTHEISNIADKNSKCLVILSAKDSDSLNKYAQRMVDYLHSEASIEASLPEIAFTIQTGREAMEERLAIIAETKDELINKYESYLQGIETSKLQNDAIFLGNSEDVNEDPYLRLLKKKLGDHMSHDALDLNELEELALLWVKGMDIQWVNFYKDENIRKVSLPTYPFVRERCWVETENEHERAPEPQKPINEEEKVFELDHTQSLKSNISKYLTDTLSEELKIVKEKIKTNKNIRDYGLDSIVGMKIIRGIDETFQIRMTGREMLEHTTIESISEHLAKKSELRQTKNNKVDAIEIQQIHEKDAPTRTELSEGQKGFWTLQKFTPDMSAYNVPIAFKIEQKLDVSSFKKACEFLFKEYPILNTVIQEDNGMPYQIQSDGDLFFKEEKINHLKENEIISFVQKRAKEPFVLETGPLFRVNLFSKSEDDMIVLITIHHIIVDGTSALIFIKSLWNAYYSYINNIVPQHTVHETTYSNFVEWEKNMLENREGEEHLNYWKDQLTGELPVLALPAKSSCPAKQSYKGRTYTKILDSRLSKKIKSFAKTSQMNLSVPFLGLFKLLLHRYSGQEDIIVGMPTLGRPERRFENVFGYFINMVPLRSQLSDDQPFIEFLKELQLTLVDGLDHSAYPFPKLVKNLKLKQKQNQNQSTAAVYKVSLVFQNFAQNISIKKIINSGLINFGDEDAQISILKEIHQTGEDEIALEISEDSDSFCLDLKYNSGSFNDSTIKKMMGHYIKLAQEVLKKPDQKMGCYDMLLKDEKLQLLTSYNDTARPYPADKTIHGLFEDQVNNTPNNVAVSYNGSDLTYKELNEKANQLGHYLQLKGVKPDNLVAICVDRSLEMMIGVLGILKSGGAYVPVDPCYPEDRIRHMLNDSKAKVILTQEKLIEMLSPLNTKHCKEILCLDKMDELLINQSKTNPVNETKSNNLVYVIYTSGSTGLPKGVMVEHKGVSNLQQAQREILDVHAEDRVLQFASISFDAACSEIVMTILSGATLVLADKEVLTDAGKLELFIKNNNISIATLPPVMLNVLDTSIVSSLNKIISAGEACPLSLLKKWAGKCKLFNGYGPTEDSVCATMHLCDSNATSPPPIGKPIDNNQLYILDSNLNPVPQGVTGELHIGGEGLARGYLNKLKLTKEKFIVNPFSKKRGSRLYKTGDLARYLEAGNVEYIGRIDDQVKIRGFRIECGEIETQISKIEKINMSVVMPEDDEHGNKRLVAYVVGDEKLDAQKIKKELEITLPDYMIPSIISQIPVMPLTPNGKVDKKALLALDVKIESDEAYVTPKNKIEERLTEIFKEVLTVEKVGVNDDFFNLGGHSILAISLIAKINDEFLSSMDVSILFEDPTIAGLAEHVRNASDNEDFDIIVPLHENGKNRPIFMAPGIGGNVLGFYDFVESLGKDQPLFGMQSIGIDGKEEPLKTIEEIAAANIKAIKDYQQTGPYRLVGHSFGGHVAYETARQLTGSGEKLDYLILLDVFPYFESGMKNMEEIDLVFGICKLSAESYNINVTVDKDTLQKLNKQDRLVYIQDQFALKGVTFSLDQLTGMINVHKTNSNICYSPKGKLMDTNVILFKAKDMMENIDVEFDIDRYIKQKDYGWQKYVANEIKIYETFGNHFSMLQKENVHHIATKLKEFYLN